MVVQDKEQYVKLSVVYRYGGFYDFKGRLVSVRQGLCLGYCRLAYVGLARVDQGRLVQGNNMLVQQGRLIQVGQERKVWLGQSTLVYAIQVQGSIG